MTQEIQILANHDGVELTIPLSLSSPARTSKISVRRRRDSKFVFDKHYENHFKSMKSGAKDAYDGCAMRQTEDGTIVCRDEHVRMGSTYVYWIGIGDRDPLGPFAVKIRDREVWWPRDDTLDRMKSIARRHPGLAEYRVYGTSVSRRIIPGLTVGNRERCIALIGLVHAGESGPELTIPALERLAAEQPDLLKRIGVAILPSVNSDERERQVNGCPWYLRGNPRGVDLNRNFDVEWNIIDRTYGISTDDPGSATYRGRKPESEPETRAVVNFIRETAPQAVFSYHSLACICGACFLVGSKAAQDDPAYVAACKAFACAYTDGMYPSEGRHLRMRFSCAPGSLPAWLYRELGIPAFDLEHDGNEDSRPALIDRTDRKLLELYQERHYGGIKAVLEMLAAKA